MKLEDENTVRPRNVEDTTSEGVQYLRRRKIISAPLREPVNLNIIWKAYVICHCGECHKYGVLGVAQCRLVGYRDKKFSEEREAACLHLLGV